MSPFFTFFKPHGFAVIYLFKYTVFYQTCHLLRSLQALPGFRKTRCEVLDLTVRDDNLIRSARTARFLKHTIGYEHTRFQNQEMLQGLVIHSSLMRELQLVAIVRMRLPVATGYRQQIFT